MNDTPQNPDAPWPGLTLHRLASMLSTRDRVRFGAAVVAATAILLTGCSKGGAEKAQEAPSAAPSAAPTAASRQQAAGAPGDGPIGISAGGVTTRIDEPAQSTEEQYGQSCLATKAWMDSKGGDPHTLVEPYLSDLQKAKDPSPATFNKTWAELNTAQQAAVIIAVKAAADGGC